MSPPGRSSAPGPASPDLPDAAGADALAVMEAEPPAAGNELDGDALLAITRGARRLETLLGDRLGATGRGLRTKADDVRDRLPPELLKQLRWVATMRNKTLHEDGFSPSDLPRLIDTMQDCAQALEALATSPPDGAIATDAGREAASAGDETPAGQRAGNGRRAGRGRAADAAPAARRMATGAVVFVLLLLVLALTAAG